MRLWKRALGGLTVIAAAAVLAPAALASTAPTMTLDQSAGTSAGGTHNLGLNLAFTNSGSDSPKSLTLNLPPGLLANAAADGGACLRTAASTKPVAACQVGSGTVTAQPDLTIPGVPAVPPVPPLLPGLPGIPGIPAIPASVPAPVSVPVSFYLVAPPSGSDLAGLEVYSSTLGEQLGGTGDILIRPSGDPAGVGATIKLTLPDTLNLTLPVLGPVNAAQISITKIASTFDGLRYPATCSGLNLTATVNSYGDPTLHSLSQPLSVSDCAGLAYNPKFGVSAARDKTDKAVTLTTTITQTASESPNSAVSLTFPTSFLGANINSLGTFCANATGAGCTTVGSVTAASPLYPMPLTGKAYLTGTTAGLTLTLVFPAPFPLTLVGKVSLGTNTAAFTGLPDIPLTSLSVTLNGGPKGLFETNCVSPTGTATAGLTDQAGDKTRSVPANFTVSGCPAGTGTTTGTGTGSGSGSASGSATGSGSGSGSGTGGSTTTGPTSTVSGTRLAAKTISGLAKGKPSLVFTISAMKKHPRLKRITVKLPAGLRFRHHKVDTKNRVNGVTLTGARAKSLKLSHGRLVITLRRSSRKVTVKLGTASLKESAALRKKVQRKTVKRLKLQVAVRNTKHKSHTLMISTRLQQ